MKSPISGTVGKNPEKKPKSPAREWAESIFFAVVAATLIRWLVLEPFVIPTPSMEKSLLVGDYLFVSKMHYGARTANTPLQVPLTFQKIWGTNIPSYLESVQLPSFRLPGFSEVKRYDNVVFNYPPERENPVDMRTYYIKRCIGIPGDTLEIRNGVFYVNNAPIENPAHVQSSYFIQSKGISEAVFKKYDITEYHETRGGYEVNMTPETALKLRQLDFIEDVIAVRFQKNMPIGRGFPNNKDYDWNIDNFGPLYIPQKGRTVSINKESLAVFGDAIRYYEGLKNVKIEDDQLFIDDQAVSEYTFNQNYYFMIGDNRHNSADSRYWGFVPEDHVVGKAVLIWWSVEPGSLTTIFSRVRWERLFSLIK